MAASIPHRVNAAGRERRYCARLPFALIERLRELDPERLLYTGAKLGPGGNGPLLLTPLEPLDRLAALVPPPRTHRSRYFGVLASTAAHWKFPRRRRTTGAGHSKTVALLVSRHSGVRPLPGAASGWCRRYLPLAHLFVGRSEERLFWKWRHAPAVPRIRVEVHPKVRGCRRSAEPILAKANAYRSDREKSPPNTQRARSEVPTSLRPVSYRSEAHRTRHAS